VRAQPCPSLASSPRVTHRQRSSRPWLLAALAAVLPLDGGPLLHQHGGGAIALYNANCPLLAVAACHSLGIVVVPASPPAVPVPAGVVAFSPDARPGRPAARHADSRAPPLV